MTQIDSPQVVPNYSKIQAILGGLLLLIVVLGAIASGRSGEASELPAAIDVISPVEGSQVPRQFPITIDMAVGYDIQLSIQKSGSSVWEAVPLSEMSYEPATGVYVWSPTADGFIGELGSGNHRLRVSYRGIGTSLDAGTYEWTFRTY